MGRRHGGRRQSRRLTSSASPTGLRALALRGLAPPPGAAWGAQRSGAGAPLRTKRRAQHGEAPFIYPPRSPRAGEAVTEGPTARQGTAAAGLIPVAPMCRRQLAHEHERSQGQLPAYARHVRTHEYQSGGQPAHRQLANGQPAHVALACCRALGRSPPGKPKTRHRDPRSGRHAQGFHRQDWFLRARKQGVGVDLTNRSISVPMTPGGGAPQA